MGVEDEYSDSHMEEDVEDDQPQPSQRLKQQQKQQQQQQQAPPAQARQQQEAEEEEEEAAPAAPAAASAAVQQGGDDGLLESIESYIREVDATELSVRCAQTPPAPEPASTAPVRTPVLTLLDPLHHTQVGDDIFFERDGGFLEPGIVLELARERSSGRVLAVVQYQDKTWAKYAGYNQRKDVETLLVADQLVNRSRTRRPPRPITRYQPPVEQPTARTSKGKGKGAGAVGDGGGGGGAYKTALPVDEEKERKKREREKKRRRKQRRERREAARQRREARARRRVLGRRFLQLHEDSEASDEEEAGALTEAETAELAALLGVEEDAGAGAGAGAIRAALERLLEEGGGGVLDDAMDVTASDSEGSITSSSSSAASSSSSSNGESSTFPEPDSPSEAEPTEESDVGLSDVSTDSCPSEPEYLYWPRLATPGASERKTAGLQRFALCPKADSDDSEESDEEEQEMGLTATVVAWTTEERKALLREYLARPASASRRARTGALSFKEWCLALHIISEDSGGIGHLESCQAIKGVKRCEGMRTMYGAIRAPLIQEMIRMARITPQDRFIDIGSGLGTVVLQMAAVAGCCKATVRACARARACVLLAGRQVLCGVAASIHVACPHTHRASSWRSRATRCRPCSARSWRCAWRSWARARTSCSRCSSASSSCRATSGTTRRRSVGHSGRQAGRQAGRQVLGLAWLLYCAIIMSHRALLYHHPTRTDPGQLGDLLQQPRRVVRRDALQAGRALGGALGGPPLRQVRRRCVQWRATEGDSMSCHVMPCHARTAVLVLVSVSPQPPCRPPVPAQARAW